MDTLGFALLKNNRLEDARKVLEKAVILLPDNPTVAYHLALAYKESGDKANALKMLQKSLALGEFADAKVSRITCSRTETIVEGFMKLAAPFLIVLDAVLAIAAIFSAAVVRLGYAEVSTKLS